MTTTWTGPDFDEGQPPVRVAPDPRDIYVLDAPPAVDLQSCIEAEYATERLTVAEWQAKYRDRVIAKAVQAGWAGGILESPDPVRTLAVRLADTAEGADPDEPDFAAWHPTEPRLYRPDELNQGRTAEGGGA